MNTTQTHRVPMAQAPAADVAQAAAAFLWTAATCEDRAIASSDSAVYRAAEQAFMSAVTVAYQLTEVEALATRALLSELGPDDAARDTGGAWGVASYVIHARREVAELNAEQAEREATDETAAADDATWDDYQASYQGQDITTAYLASCHVGTFLRKLGAGWSVRLADLAS